ncbi:glycosyltransferase [Patescibacteria group bacterium]|nr:glycosyltransferase [Patescibacteria group bacterium]
MASARKLPSSAYAGINVGFKETEITLQVGEKISNYKLPKTDDLIAWFEEIASKNKIKVIAAALHGEGDLKELGSKLWLRLDIVPLVINNNLDKSTEDLARLASNRFVDDIIKIKLGSDNKVEVIDLVTLDDYKKITSPKDFELLIKLADKFKNKKIVFFSATPRGGGVALMRHALMGFFRLVGVNASWHVMEENDEVFEITKKKFHNVLHGIAPKGVNLTEKDKKVYNDWIKENAERLHSLFHDSQVIVIDDPQPSGLVPYIKRASPKKKIIYRSHIQLETSLFDNPKNPQSITWNFIWENIKSADLFISHPVKKFIPKIVDKDKVLLMTACIDRLDGLNKPLTKNQMRYYYGFFNEYLVGQGQTPLDLKRPYIVQVARFDPSKGIPDVVESYRLLREMLKDENISSPQLVITGQGSVDDPEGLPILDEILEMIKSPKYRDIQEDIKVARTPAIDQIQNTLMRGAKIYLQLSYKEGFEDKISASLLMGVPVIIYNVGGMPLQVIEGKSGYIVDKGDTGKVAEHMFQLLADSDLHKKMSEGAIKYAIADITTISNVINWLYLANELVDRGKVKGGMQKVYDLARENSVNN